MSHLPDRIEFDSIARLSFQVFLEMGFAELNGSEPYHDSWHIALLAQWVEQVRAGQTKRLVVNMPPRNLKSIVWSVSFVAWVLGHDPSAKLICASYNDDLAVRLARMCLQVMQSHWYRRLFPDHASHVGASGCRKYHDDCGWVPDCNVCRWHPYGARGGFFSSSTIPPSQMKHSRICDAPAPTTGFLRPQSRD